MNTQANLGGEQGQQRDRSLNKSVLVTFQAASGNKIGIVSSTFLGIPAFY